MTVKKFAIVGGGLSGATIAQALLSCASEIEITVFEKQSNVGGNLREKSIGGTLVHEHGPHIFHTKSDEVWRFIKPFSEWEPYFHRVTAYVRGQNVPIPFNFRSLDILYGDLSSEIKSLLLGQYGHGARVSVLKLMQDDNKLLRDLGDEIFNTVFKGYSEKQWGAPVGEVSKGVLSRVPVVVSYDDRYFDDKYQFIPVKGYTDMIHNMFSSDRITIKLNHDVDAYSNDLERFDHIFCTGAIDDFFGLKHGNLNYRSLVFEQIEASSDFPNYPTHQTNFPNEYEFTRVVKYGMLNTQTSAEVYIAEFPKEYSPGDNKYYPVANAQTENIYNKYVEEAKNYPNITFSGRLADFKYYNMDQVIARAIKQVKNYKLRQY